MVDSVIFGAKPDTESDSKSMVDFEFVNASDSVVDSESVADLNSDPETDVEF